MQMPAIVAFLIALAVAFMQNKELSFAGEIVSHFKRRRR